MVSKQKKLTRALMVAFFSIALTQTASAFTAPTAGFAYDVYDIVVNDILKGPIGFTGGVAAMALGAIMAMQAKIMAAVPTVVGGAMLMKADTLVTSMGALI